MRVKAAINGGTSRALHARVPITAEEIADDVIAVAAAGAFAVHFHPRDPEGKETLSGDAVADAMRAIRRHAVGIPVGVTTGAWITPNAAERLAQINGWSVLPDFASVNFDEDGAVALALALLEHGVGIEAGMATVKAAEALVRSELSGRCIRMLLEPQEQSDDDAEANVLQMERILNGAGETTPRLLHGTLRTAWSMLKLAKVRGYDGRIGFEDTVHREDGSLASSNAELVRLATDFGVR